MMKAEIIAIGSELLTPYRSDTNSLWLTEQLNKYGIKVSQKHIVGDDAVALKELFKEAGKRADYVFTSGGLGPTFDDITRETLAETFNLELEYHEEIFGWIEDFYRQRNAIPTENNRRQAYVPQNGDYFSNNIGTAPGLLVKNDLCTFILLPGPPSEFKAVFNEIEKAIFEHKTDRKLYTRKFKLANVPESLAETKIGKIDIPDFAEWSILASFGQVEAHLHVNCSDVDSAMKIFDDFEKHLVDTLGNHYFGYDDIELEDAVAKLLMQNGHTISLAESCTGGWLAQRLTNVSGSSKYFLLSAVTYSNEAKISMLAVKESTLTNHGAVSRETALEMARGIRKRSGSDASVAITGIAGPTGGTEDKPVGTVYIAAIAADGSESCYRFLFLGNREKIRFQATQSALDLIRMPYFGARLESAFIVNE